MHSRRMVCSQVRQVVLGPDLGREGRCKLMNSDSHFSVALALIFRDCTIVLGRLCPPRYANGAGRGAGHSGTILICVNAS